MENITTHRKKEYSNYVVKNSQFLWVCLLVLHTEISGQPRPQGTKLFSGKLLLIQVYLTMASDRVCMKRSRIRYIQGKLKSLAHWSAIAQGGHLFCSHDGEFAIKVMLKVQGWDNLSFTGAYDPSCKNVSTMSTMYISAQCEFTDIPIASLLGWGICSICTHFHKPGTRSPGREKRTKKIAERSARKRVEEVQQRSGGKRSHSPLQTLQFPCRLLAIFSPVRPKR